MRRIARPYIRIVRLARFLGRRIFSASAFFPAAKAFYAVNASSASRHKSAVASVYIDTIRVSGMPPSSK